MTKLPHLESVWIAEGWKLVPVAPTTTMQIAAFSSLNSFDHEEWDQAPNIQAIWKEMLEVSPPPPLSDGRNAIIEECAAVAQGHDHEAGIKKLGKANWKYTPDEARASINDESRGEQIAAELIAKAIRALKSTKPGGESESGT